MRRSLYHWQLGLACLALVPTMAPNAQGPCSLTVGVVQENGAVAPAGVTVRAFSEDGSVLDSTTTGHQGQVRFGGINCGPVRLEIGQWRGAPAPGFTAWSEEEVFLLAGVPGRTQITIRPVTPVTASVIDADSRPAPTGLFVVYPLPDSRPGLRHSVGQVASGAEGQTRFLLHQGRYRVTWGNSATPPIRTMVDGLEVEYPAILDVGDAPVRVEFQVPNQLEVAGRVTDPTDRGFEGIEMRAIAEGGGENRYSAAALSSDGRFRLAVRNFPALVVPFDLTEQSSFEPEMIRLEQPADSDIVFEVRRRHGPTLLGLAVDKDTGDPLVGFEVSVGADLDCTAALPDHLRIREPTVGWTRTDKLGRFSSRCSTRCPTVVRVSGQGPYLPTSVTIPSEQCEGEHRFTLDRGAVIRGSVIDRKGGPIADLPLSSGTRRFRTDAEGRFRLQGLSPGTYTFSVDSRLANDEQRYLVLVSRRAGDNTLARVGIAVKDRNDHLDVEMKALRGGSVCAYVESEQGHAPALTRLELFEQDKEEPQYRRQAGGHARERIRPDVLCSETMAPGSYQARLSGDFVPTWWPGRAERILAEPFDVRPGEEVTLDSVTVVPAGSIVVELPGWPWPDQGDPVFEFAPEHDTESTQGEGEKESPTWQRHDRVSFNSYARNKDPERWREAPRFTLESVPTGRYQLRVCPERCRNPDEILVAPKPVVVRTGKRTTLRLLFPPDRAARLEPIRE